MIIREAHERPAQAWLVGSESPFSENALSAAFVLSVDPLSYSSCCEIGPETHFSGGFKPSCLQIY